MSVVTRSLEPPNSASSANNAFSVFYSLFAPFGGMRTCAARSSLACMESQQSAHGPTAQSELQTSYSIEVEGRLQHDWSEFFSGMQIEEFVRADQSVVTKITGSVRDQSELSGLLSALANLDMPIVSVNTIDAGDSGNS